MHVNMCIYDSNALNFCIYFPYLTTLILHYLIAILCITTSR